MVVAEAIGVAEQSVVSGVRSFHMPPRRKMSELKAQSFGSVEEAVLVQWMVVVVVNLQLEALRVLRATTMMMLIQSCVVYFPCRGFSSF